MRKGIKIAPFSAGLAALLLIAPAHGLNMNKSIKVDAGSNTGGQSSVNGNIFVGAGSVIDGSLETVNGSIRVEEDVTLKDAGTVNGTISLVAGSKVADDVSNVNGEISLSGAEIGGNLSTVNGDVSLDDGSTLRGDLIVEKPGGWHIGKRKPKVTIGQNSRVLGNIVLKREVELYISDSAEIGGVSGKMSMDDVIRFSGNSP